MNGLRARYRQIGQHLAVHRQVHGGGIELERADLFGDGDRLGNIADSEHRVHSHVGADLNEDILLNELC